MIPDEDWKAVNIPGSRLKAPRRFKWKFKDFKKAMKGKRLKRAIVSEGDRITVADMEMMHGGRYWPMTDGGLIALPYDSKKFDFNEWVEQSVSPTTSPMSSVAQGIRNMNKPNLDRNSLLQILLKRFRHMHPDADHVGMLKDFGKTPAQIAREHPDPDSQRDIRQNNKTVVKFLDGVLADIEKAYGGEPSAKVVDAPDEDSENDWDDYDDEDVE